MKIYKNFNIGKRFQNSAIAIGNFDGFHLGHQRVIKKGKQIARKNNLKFGLMVFQPLPVMFFNKNLKNYRIDSLRQKINSSKKYGINFLIVKKFDKKFSKNTSDVFVKDILHKKLKAKFIFVSNNFRFGYKREGNVFLLKKFQKFYGYKIINPKPLKKKNKIISSTLVRKLLRAGKLNLANNYLNRNWSIEGVVEKGRRVAKKIGFPTCNISLGNYIIAKPGVYAVKVFSKNINKPLKGIANLGYRPTFNQKKILLEVNLFNFSRNLYNKKLTVEFIKFIRKEKKFKGINSLRKQIKLDLKIAKKV